MRTKYVGILSNMEDLLTHPDVSQLISEFGWENGNTFREIIRSILKDSGISPECTLGDLKKLLRKEFACVATDLNASAPIVLSSTQTPELQVCDAIYMSSSVPFVFKPMKFEERMVVDGCMTCNLPQLFPESETMFWYISHSTQSHPIRSWPDFLQNIAYCSMNLQTLPSNGVAVKFKLNDALEANPSFDMNINAEVAAELFDWGYKFMTNLLTDGAIVNSFNQLITLIIEMAVNKKHDCYEAFSPGFANVLCT